VRRGEPCEPPGEPATTSDSLHFALCTSSLRADVETAQALSSRGALEGKFPTQTETATAREHHVGTHLVTPPLSDHSSNTHTHTTAPTLAYTPKEGTLTNAHDGLLANHPLRAQAYCLYRMKRCEEALVTIEEVGHDKAEAALQLQAQVLFRLRRFDECIERYETLLAEHKGARGSDVVANVAAAYVASGRSAELPAAMRALDASPHAFEISYNTACGLIQMGDFAAAEEMLLVAQRELSRPMPPPAVYVPPDVLQDLRRGGGGRHVRFDLVDG